MDIKIENSGHGKSNVLESRLFFCFAQRDIGDVRFAVGVSAELNPTVQLPVVCQKHFRPGGIHKPCGANDMPGAAASFEAIGMGDDELKKSGLALSIRSRFCLVGPKLFHKKFAIHRISPRVMKVRP